MELKVEGIDNLDKILDLDVEDRMRAMQRTILRSVVEKVLHDIVKAIPTNEKWLRVYRKSLKIFDIQDLPKGQVGYMISSHVSGDWSMVEASKMVVYFQANPRSEAFEIGKVLEEYSPFSVNMVPNLEQYGARVMIRRVRTSEVEAVRQGNEKQRESLIDRLMEHEAELRPGPAKIGGKLFFDMDFAVMRMELGFGDIKRPHWRPALRRASIHLAEILRSSDLKNKIASYFDVKSVEWVDDASPKYPPVRGHRMDDFADFQRKVTPRIL